MENEKLYSLYKDLSQKELNDEFIAACKYDHLNIIKYLLTSPDLDNHADIHYQDDESISLACSRGNLKIVKYLLTSPELKEHANIHTQKDCSFGLSVLFGHEDVVQCLIFDMNIEKTKDIIKYLEEEPCSPREKSLMEQANCWFNFRELNRNLNNELSSEKINSKKIKI